jgi:hypothetical protein
MNTNAAVDNLIYSALHWPGKTSRLAADSLQDHVQRPVSPSSSVAELYHVNSKLYPSNAAGLLVARVDAASFRLECIRRTRVASARAQNAERMLVSPALQRLLALTTAELDMDVFYAVEIRARLVDRLLAWDPSNAEFTALKGLTESDASLLEAALKVLGRPPRLAPHAALFVIGWFARNDVLLGPRGYRRTLLEAGRVLEVLLRVSRTLGIENELHTEFTDVDVDRVLEADGVETGTLAVLTLSEHGNEGR